MENSVLSPSNIAEIKVLLEAIVVAGVPALVSGKVAERFGNLGLIPTSSEVELILRPDLKSAMEFVRAMQKLAARFGYTMGGMQDAAKLSLMAAADLFGPNDPLTLGRTIAKMWFDERSRTPAWEAPFTRNNLYGEKP